MLTARTRAPGSGSADDQIHRAYLLLGFLCTRVYFRIQDEDYIDCEQISMAQPLG